MYGKNLYQNSFYAKFISTAYASTQIAVLYIGMYYNVTLGLPLTYIAAVSVIIFFYDNFIKSFCIRLISIKYIFCKKRYLTVLVFLVMISLVFLFHADRYLNQKSLFYYYFFSVIVYETFFTLLNVYLGYRNDKSDLNGVINKRHQFIGLTLSAIAFPIIHYFADFTLTAVIYASAGFILLLYLIIVEGEKVNAPYSNFADNSLIIKNNIKYIISSKNYLSSYVKYLLFESSWLIVICSFPVYTKFSLDKTFVPVALFQFCILIPVLIIKYFYADKIKSNNKIHICGLLTCIAGSALYFFSNGILITSLASLFFGLGYAAASNIHENDLSSSIIEFKQTDERKYVSLKYFNERATSLSSVLRAISLCSLTFIFGYHSGINHGPQASVAWRFAYGIIPVVFILIIFTINIFTINNSKHHS